MSSVVNLSVKDKVVLYNKEMARKKEPSYDELKGGKRQMHQRKSLCIF